MNRDTFGNSSAKIVATEYLTSHQAAQLIQVNPSSVVKWAVEGRIKSHRTPGGHRRIQAADFVAFLTKYEIPIPAPLAGITPAQPKKVAKKRASPRKR